MTMYGNEKDIEDLKGFTIEELTAEIERKQKVSQSRPQVGGKLAEDKLIKALLELHIENMIRGESTGPDDTDFQSQLYEVIMNSAFGNDVMDWISDNLV